MAGLASQAPASATIQCETDRAVIDGVTIAYDKVVKVVGICIKPDFYELSPRQAELQAVRIGDRGNQDKILIHLMGIAQTAIPKPGQWCAVMGHLGGGNAYATPPQLSMKVDTIEPISEAPLTPADFVDRAAVFEGNAEAGGLLNLEAGSLRVLDWPAEAVGKHVAVTGVVRKDGNAYRLEKPEWHLVELQDLVGKSAMLEGAFFSMNDVFWFGYRDQRLIVTDAKDHPVKNLYDQHGGKARVTGLLVKQLRPSLEQISLKDDRDLVPTFVVRRAKIEFLEPPVDHDKRYFQQIFPDGYMITDGVPELVAGSVMHRNIMGNETRSRDYVERNDAVIKPILRNATPTQLNVLAKRMVNTSLDADMRLVYAAMLAAANDARGRTYLTQSADQKDNDLHSVLFCLGAFSWLMPDDAKIKTDIAWAEPVLIRQMSERDKSGKFTRARDAVVYSDIPRVLARLNTRASTRVLVEYAVANVDPTTSFFSANALRILSEMPVTVSHADILQLERAIKEPADRRSVLHIALRENDAEAASLFFVELGQDNWFASDMRDLLTPEIGAALQKKLPDLPAAAQSEARRLIIHGLKDPVPSLLGLLSDPKYPDKNAVLWELTQHSDPRVIAPVFKVLHDAPKDFFLADDLPSGLGVEHGLSAIAAADNKDAAAALIELFDVDLSRFSTLCDREGYRRLIAAHLIDMTGESFGTDAVAWKKWNSSRLR